MKTILNMDQKTSTPEPGVWLKFSRANLPKSTRTFFIINDILWFPIQCTYHPETDSFFISGDYERYNYDYMKRHFTYLMFVPKWPFNSEKYNVHPITQGNRTNGIRIKHKMKDWERSVVERVSNHKDKVLRDYLVRKRMTRHDDLNNDENRIYSMAIGEVIDEFLDNKVKSHNLQNGYK